MDESSCGDPGELASNGRARSAAPAASKRRRPGPRTARSIAAEHALADGAVNTPIGVHHLGHPEIRGNREQRNRLILAQAMYRHEEAAQLAEGVAHGLVEARAVG